MHGKDIKARIRKQLKTQFPNWHRLTRMEKKGIARQVLEQVVENYDFPKKVATPLPELIGLSDQQPTQAIMTIEQMAKFVDAHQSDLLLRLYGKHRAHPAIKDIELQRIDSLIDDRIVNKLLAPDG